MPALPCQLFLLFTLPCFKESGLCVPLWAPSPSLCSSPQLNYSRGGLVGGLLLSRTLLSSLHGSLSFLGFLCWRSTDLPWSGPSDQVEKVCASAYPTPHLSSPRSLVLPFPPPVAGASVTVHWCVQSGDGEVTLLHQVRPVARATSHVFSVRPTCPQSPRSCRDAGHLQLPRCLHDFPTGFPSLLV